MSVENTKAFIVVDIQNDFIAPGGSLGVTNGADIIPFINNHRKDNTYDTVVLTQDWHPSDHISFASTHSAKPFSKHPTLEIDLWPDHCVQFTHGAALREDMITSERDVIVYKGTTSGHEFYSAFSDIHHKEHTGLEALLRRRKITEVVVVGLAYDYCVKQTALDAVKLGFKTTVLLEGTRAVDQSDAAIAATSEDLRAAGVILK